MHLIERSIDILVEKCVDFSGRPNYHAGAENVARKLLMLGSCLVAGDGHIGLKTGRSSFGDFITCEKSMEAEGCTLLKLDLKGFLKSPATVKALDAHTLKTRAKIDELEGELQCVREIKNMTLKTKTQPQKNNAD